MTLSFARCPLSALALVAGMVLAAASAKAQGTDEQREACTPDALRLCQATIPDIPKTTACMKAHFAQLSPRCKLAFNGATGAPPASERHREAAVPAAPDASLAPDVDVDVDIGGLPGTDSYAAQIRGYCRQGLIDPFTCRNTLAALRGIE